MSLLRRGIAFIWIVLTSACSLQWQGVRTTSILDLEQAQIACAKLDGDQVGWNVASITLGGLAGASGLTTIAVPNNRNVNIAMGSIAVIVTVGSAVAAYLAQHYTQRFCRECANIVPPLAKPGPLLEVQ